MEKVIILNPIKWEFERNVKKVEVEKKEGNSRKKYG